MKIKSKTDTFSQYAFLTLLFALPLVFSEHIADSYIVMKWCLLQIIGSCLLFYLLFYKSPHSLKKGILTPAMILIIVYFLINVISIFAAINSHESLKHLGRIFFLFVIVMFLCVERVDLDYFRKCTRVLSIGLIPICIYGICQYFGYDIILLEKKTIVVSTLGNPNYVAQYLVEVIPLLIGGFLISSKRMKLSWGAVLALGVFTLIATESRGGFLAFVCSMLFMSVLFVFYRLTTRFASPAFFKTFAKRIAVIVLICLALLFGINHFNEGRVLENLATTFSKTSYTNRLRVLFWKDTLSMIKDHPISGVGIGNFEIVFPEYTSEELWAIRDIAGKVKTTRTHNDYLNIAAETGIFGLVAFVCILGYIFLKSIRFLMRRKSEPDDTHSKKSLIVISLLGTLCATMVHSSVDFNLYNPASALIFWVSIGFLAKLTNGERQNRKPKKTATRGIRERSTISQYAIIALCVVSVLTLSTYFLKTLAGAFYLQQGKVHSTLRETEQAIDSLDKAHKISPHNRRVLLTFADTLRNARMFSQAAHYYTKYISLDPNFSPVHNRLGVCYMSLKKYNDAQKAFLKTIDINPHNLLALNNLGAIYYGAKQWEKAIEFYKRGYKKDTSFSISNRRNLADAYFNAGNYEKALETYEDLYYNLGLSEDEIMQKINLCRQQLPAKRND